MRDIAEFCDGWMPIGTRHEIAGKVEQVRTVLTEAGRDPDALELTLWQAPRDVDQLLQMKEFGVTRAVFGLPPVEPEIVIEKLDRYAALAAAVRG
jgi:alkanesulfonate monooxygenase SsuD/methylene tetrahydromethanopterin reductase-like flavin-dependent oxidoreductase (luciferase family)